MKNLTIEMLRKKRACSSGIDFCRDQNTEDLRELFEAFIKHERYDYATWVFRRFMNKKQVVKYAVFAAEQVIEIYEKKYPEDDRPRKAIEAAKAYLKKPCASTKKKAAAYADAADAAAAAADAAADAAYAAAYAADAAAYAYAAGADGSEEFKAIVKAYNNAGTYEEGVEVLEKMLKEKEND